MNSQCYILFRVFLSQVKKQESFWLFAFFYKVIDKFTRLRSKVYGAYKAGITSLQSIALNITLSFLPQEQFEVHA